MRSLKPLEPREGRHQRVECITTKERPGKINLVDEEVLDNIFTQFGAACRDLPSSVPQRMSYGAHHYNNLAE